MQKALDGFGSQIKELKWADGFQHMEYCELCGRLAVGRPCIYNGKLTILDFECIYRIHQGYPMLER